MRAALLLAAAIGLGVAAADLPSGVHRWSDGTILSGSTTDLARLDVRGVSLPPGVAIHVDIRADSEETLVIVKDGRLRVTLGSAVRTLGRGSVAVVLPGDAARLSSAGDAPASYYVLSYRSRAPMDLARGRRAGGSFVVDRDSVAVRPTATGARRDVFDRPTAMFRRFEIHVSTLNEALVNHAVHTHRAEELVVMMDGGAGMTIGEAGRDVLAGDVVFLASGVPHNLRNTGKGAAEYFAIQGQ